MHNMMYDKSSSSRAPRDRRQTHAQHDMWSQAVLRGYQGTGGKHMRNMICDRSSSTRAPRDRRHIRNPESLNSGMLVGEHPTLSTGIRTRPPPHRYGVGSIPTSIPDFRNSGMLGTCTYGQKHFYEGAKSQEALWAV